MPAFIEERSRVFAGGTFFRSKNAGSTSNLIEVEYVSSGGVLLNVYDNGILVESFGPVPGPEVSVPNPTPPPATTCTPTVNPAMRALVNGNSNYIQMPTLDYGGEPANASPIAIFNSSNPPDDPVTPGDDCSFFFGPTFLSGGSGPPTDSSTLATIRTGPERSMVIVTLTEIINDDASDDGRLFDPPPPEKVRQYDGTDWIPYIPNADC